MKINFLLFALFVGLWCTVGCKSRTETPAIVTEQRVDTVKSDSVATDSTSTAAETPIPKKADEYFDGDRGQALLQEAIATLPDVQRTVFTLRYFDEMKYSDMSELLGTSVGALKASYHIAVEKVTTYMKQHE